jgi:RHS repeat-associated protein
MPDEGSPSDNPELMYYSTGDRISGIGSPHYMVNTSTLRLFVHDTLYSYKGKGPAVVLALTYTHNPGRIGPFGRNWTSSYESTIEQSGDRITIRKESGSRLVFRQIVSPDKRQPGIPAEAAAPAGVFDRLIDYGQYWMYIIKDSRILLLYDKIPGGVARLSRIADLDNNTVTLAFNADGSIRSVTDACGRSTLFSYNTSRQCISVTLPDGRTASFAYDARQNLAGVTDFGGIQTAYEYDKDHALIRIRKGQGPAVTTFAYGSDQLGKHIRTITGPDGNTTAYDLVSADPRQIRITDPEGGTLRYFSDQGKTTRVIDQLGNAAEFGTGGGKRTSYRDKNGNVTQLEYDGRGNLIRTSTPDGATRRYHYDAHDNLVAEIDALGRQTTYQYDSRQHLIKTVTPTGRDFLFEYDTAGQLVRMVDPSGKAVTLHNDRFGNVDEISDGSGYATKLSYDTWGLRMTAETDARGNTRRYEYDGNDRIVGIQNPDGSVTRFGFDSEGKLQTIDRNGTITRYVRNPRGRVLKRTEPLADTVLFDYDRNNRLVDRTDALNRHTRFAYDPASRLTKLTTRLGGTVDFVYDNEGNLVRISDENGNATRFGYGKNYLIETITDALDRSVRVGQDVLGRVVSVTNARGNTVSQSYNQDDEISEKKYDGRTVASYAYDLSENLIAVRDGLGETAYGYSSRNLIETIRYRNGSIVAFEYDENANIAAVTYPNQLRVQYTYDPMNRVSSVRWLDNTLDLFYDKAGSLVRESRSNSVESIYTFDKDQRLAGLSHRSRETVLADLRYERDPVGNIIRESGFTAGPTADPLSGVPVSSGTASVNSLNQIISSGSDTITYDADGNLTGMHGSRAFSARYDLENRPTEITSDGRHTVYEYGESGPRARKTCNGSVTEYWYAPDGILLFATGSDPGSERYYIYADGCLVAMVTADNRTFFFHADKTGNILFITDGTGQVAASYTYDPFGLVTGRSEVSVTSDFTYGGAFGVMDEGGGIYFMVNRYYDSLAGRFLQRDPVGTSGGLNLYCYSNNNPVMAIDPDGLGPKKPQGPQSRPGKSSGVLWDMKNAFDNFVESSARAVANNPYVKKGWRLFDQTVGNKIRRSVSPYRNNNIVRTLNLARQNVRSGGPPKIPASQLPTCRQIQSATRREVGQHILEGGRKVVETVSGAVPPLQGVPRVLNAAEVMYNATSRRDSGPVREAVGGYAKDKAEQLIRSTAESMAQGKDPTEGFDPGEFIVNEITGGK